MSDLEEKTLRLRLEGGPSIHNLKIIDAETGAQLRGVTEVHVDAVAGSLSVAYVTLKMIGGIGIDLDMLAVVDDVDVTDVRDL